MKEFVMSIVHRRPTLPAAIIFGFILQFAGTAWPQVPETPPGRQLSAWLAAINSGDRATMQAFMDKSMPGRPIEPGLEMGKRSGGYEVKKVEESRETRIVALLQERGPGKQFARLTISVAAEAPDRIAGIRIQPAQAPPELAPPKLSAAEAEAARSSIPFKQFMAWLEAFNSGDRERIGQFLKTHYPSHNLDAEMRFRGQTSGFEFRLLEQASPTTVTGLVQARDGDGFARFTLEVEPAEPHHITRLNLLIVP